MGRNTHGAKHRKVSVPEPAAAPEPDTAAAAAAGEDDDAEDPSLVAEAQAQADAGPADALDIEATRNARRAAKKGKREARRAAEAAAKAAAASRGEPPLLTPKEARRAARAAAIAATAAAKAAKAAAWAAAQPPPAAPAPAPVAAATALPLPPAVDSNAAAVGDGASLAEPAAPAPQPADAKPKPLLVFAGGLPFSHTPDDITSLFAVHEVAVSKVEQLTFSDSGRFRGMATLTLADDASFHKSLALNGLTLEAGTTLTVKRAKPRSASGGAADGEGDPGAAAGRKRKAATAASPLPLDEASPVVYCGNLSHEVDEASLAAAFPPACGEPLRITWGIDPESGMFRGYAHVAFGSAEAAAAAVGACDGAQLLGRPMRVAHEARRAVPRRGAATAEATAAEGGGVKGGGEGEQFVPAGVASPVPPPGCLRAYVTGLSYSSEAASAETALRAAFPGAASVKLGFDKTSGAFRGFAHITFSTPAACAAAIDAASSDGGVSVAGRRLRAEASIEKQLQAPPAAAKGVTAQAKGGAKRGGVGGGADGAKGGGRKPRGGDAARDALAAKGAVESDDATVPAMAA